MTDTKTLCDHCGKELDERVDYTDITIECAHQWQDTDLCDSCFNKLWDIIYKFCLKQEIEREKEK